MGIADVLFSFCPTMNKRLTHSSQEPSLVIVLHLPPQLLENFQSKHGKPSKGKNFQSVSLSVLLGFSLPRINPLRTHITDLTGDDC